jgi:Relaxase/Mobilisation nuclease domain
MIPRIQTGTSFQGAGLYYLHDKKLEGETERLTTERVAWTYAINTVENDPEAVLAEMRQTSFDQPILKMLSGNRIDGRPTETPVMTVALAWSPEQNPTQNQMIEAGHSYLQHMGWEAHQALFVAHNDTKHPHMHMIINRVHPETGMVLDDSWSKTRSQQWALGYERDNGRIFCQAREAKYGRREMNDAPHLHRSEWKLWQEISKENAFDPEYHRALEAGEWETLKEGQKQERIDFWKQTGQMRKDLRGVLREEVREEFKEEWRAYNALKAERHEQGRAYDKEARRALKHYARLGGMQGSAVELKEGRFWKTGHLRKDRNEIDPVSRAVQDARDLKSGYEWGGPHQ